MSARPGPRKDQLGPPNLYDPPVSDVSPLLRSGCICGKHMMQFENGGTCLWCGHGNAYRQLELAYEKATKLNTSPAFDGRVVPLRQRHYATWSEDECVEAYWRWHEAMGRVPTSADWQKPRAPGEPKRPSYQAIYNRFGGWVAFKHYIAEIPREEAVAA